MPVIEMRNAQRAADAATKCIELFWCLLREVIDTSIECIILEILEETSVKAVRSTPGRKRHVTDLRKLCVVIEGCHLQLRNPFRGRIWICSRGAIEDIRNLRIRDRSTLAVLNRSANASKRRLRYEARAARDEQRK